MFIILIFANITQKKVYSRGGKGSNWFKLLTGDFVTSLHSAEYQCYIQYEHGDKLCFWCDNLH